MLSQILQNEAKSDSLIVIFVLISFSHTISDFDGSVEVDLDLFCLRCIDRSTLLPKIAAMIVKVGLQKLLNVCEVPSES